MKKTNKLLLLALSAVLLTGCKFGGDKTSEHKADYNRIYVTREHMVSNSLIYTSEIANDTYNQDELKSFVEATVSAYNEAHGAGTRTQNTEGTDRLPVSLKSCILEGQTGKLVFDYATADDFVAFSGETGDDTNTVTSLMTDSVAQGIVKGAVIDGSFVKPDGTAVKQEEVTRQSEFSLVAVEGAATVQTEGPIMFVTEEVELLDEFTANLPEGIHYIIFK